MATPLGYHSTTFTLILQSHRLGCILSRRNLFRGKQIIRHSFTTTLLFLLYFRAVGSVLYFHSGIYSGINKSSNLPECQRHDTFYKTGNKITNSVPSPSLLSTFSEGVLTDNSPPCPFVTISYAKLKPNPVPLPAGLVV